MAWPDGWKQSVSRLRIEGAKVDPYGVPMRGTGETIVTELPPALIAPEESKDPADAGEVATYSTFTVYWPNESPDIKSSDRLQFNGSQWSVVGQPEVWPLGTTAKVRREAREWSV